MKVTAISPAFYNGARVTDWYDGSASAQFTVVSGDSTPTTVDDIQVNGVSIILAPSDSISCRAAGRIS